jgi:Holliday junction resolvase RusA-like endonuclease
MRGRGHHAWNRKKKQLEEEIGWEIRRHKLRPVRRAHLAFLFYEFSRRRDPDNIQAGSVKIILDALVKYGILENDGWDQIAGISATFSIDKENPRVEVLIDDRERDTGT